MENLVIEHKDVINKGLITLVVAVVLAAVLLIGADQFVMSVGTILLIVALAFEIIMTALYFLKAFSKEILSPDGLTEVNVFGTKTYFWKDLQRFEILWDYEGRRMIKKEEIDAPYILLKFGNPQKKIRFDYREDIDQCIRINYGQPHVDNWTNVGK